MANKFTNFVGQVFNSPYNLKDYEHASRLYVNDFYRLAPKVGFLYYVVFNINRNNNPLIQSFIQQNGSEVGLLVKGVDLPKYKMQTETLNQYNRKTIVQSKIEYQPVGVSFHDDHNNTTTRLWQVYYNYYIADGKANATGGIPPNFGNNKYQQATSRADNTAYGLNNGQTGPFFSSIEIYQLNRKQFTSFILINPMITDWSHDRMEQGETRLLENKMTVGYETVLYGTGKVKADSPAGFAKFHYDNSPSPLSIFGNGNNSLFGPGGIIPGMGEIFAGAGDTSPLGLLRSARGISNVIRNGKNISGASIGAEAYSILGGVVGNIGRTGSIQGGVSAGLGGIAAGVGGLGIGLNLFKGSNSTTNGIINARSAKVANPQVSQVPQFLANVSGGVSVSSDLPSPLPTDSASLEEIQQNQQQLALELDAQISKNKNIYASFAPKISAAQAIGDDVGLESLYTDLQTLGYTDPAKLNDTLYVVRSNIDSLQNEIENAKGSETAAPTLNSNEEALPSNYANTTLDGQDYDSTIWANNNSQDDISTNGYFV